jgi:hypothetical protein
MMLSIFDHSLANVRGWTSKAKLDVQQLAEVQ